MYKNWLRWGEIALVTKYHKPSFYSLFSGRVDQDVFANYNISANHSFEIDLLDAIKLEKVNDWYLPSYCLPLSKWRSSHHENARDALDVGDNGADIVGSEFF